MRYFSLIFSGIVFIFLFNQDIFGQESNDEPEETKHAIGIGAGFTTGYGLSYRYFPTKLGFQVNFAPYKTKETTRYSVGLSFIYPIIPGKTTSLFIYQGNHYFYNSELLYYLDEPKTIPSTEATEIRERITESFINNGLGFGMEIIFAKRIGFNIMAGYGAYDNFQQLNVTGETGLYFKF